MIRFDNEPYAQIQDALRTIVGRLFLLAVAVVLGSMLGGLTATHAVPGMWEGVLGFPMLLSASIFYGIGLFVLPALLVYAIISIRWEWPLLLSLIFVPLMWWNMHKTLRWTVYDSLSAKKMQQIDKQMQEVVDKANKRS